MPTSQQSWVEFLIEGVIGWIWIAASLVAVYFLVRAVFFGGGWWRVVVSVAVAWFLYKVTLYYQLNRTDELPPEYPGSAVAKVALLAKSELRAPNRKPSL